MLDGEHWLLGGWFYPNAIAKIEDCKISRQAESLEVPFHGGMFGSCAAYNGKIWTCFDGKDGRAKECHTFDGNQQEQVPHLAARGHDWGALGVGQFRGFLSDLIRLNFRIFAHFGNGAILSIFSILANFAIFDLIRRFLIFCYFFNLLFSFIVF